MQDHTMIHMNAIFGNDVIWPVCRFIATSRLKLIPMPKGDYNWNGKNRVCPRGCFNWSGAYIRNYTICA